MRNTVRLQKIFSVLVISFLTLTACGGKGDTSAKSPLDGIPLAQNPQKAAIHQSADCPNVLGSYKLPNQMRASLLFSRNLNGTLILATGTQEQLPIDGAPHFFDRNRVSITASCVSGMISMVTRVDNGPERRIVITPKTVGTGGLTVTDYSKNPPTAADYSRTF